MKEEFYTNVDYFLALLYLVPRHAYITVFHIYMSYCVTLLDFFSQICNNAPFLSYMKCKTRYSPVFNT